MDNSPIPIDFADLEPEDVARCMAQAAPVDKSICATPYQWPDPSALPPRQWLLGNWLLKGEVTVIIAPGGTGKSTISTAIALSLATGLPLLGRTLPRGPQSVWIYNLEDSQQELERQISAACLFYGIEAEHCQNRLFVDSGLVQPLCTATEDRDGFALNEDAFLHLASTIRENSISVIFVDPFISSHTVRESSNEAIDAIAKRWKRLAQETGCAVVLLHHTRKLGGREVTAEDGRGAVALRDAARIVLPLNAMSQFEADNLAISDQALRRSLVRIDIGKANRAPLESATWVKLESQCLRNANESESADHVGVACLWEIPDVFDGLTAKHLYDVQQALAAGDWRENVQAKDWVGHLIAQIAGLCADTHMGRIKAILRTWLGTGALAIDRRRDGKGNERPFVIVGNPVQPDEIGYVPHVKK